MKIVKYQELTTSLKSPADLSLEADRAIADFRAFYHVAIVHVERINNTLAANVLLEVLENLRDELLTRKTKGLQNEQKVVR